MIVISRLRSSAGGHAAIRHTMSASRLHDCAFVGCHIAVQHDIRTRATPSSSWLSPRHGRHHSGHRVVNVNVTFGVIARSIVLLLLLTAAGADAQTVVVTADRMVDVLTGRMV